MIIVGAYCFVPGNDVMFKGSYEAIVDDSKAIHAVRRNNAKPELQNPGLKKENQSSNPY